MTTATKTKYPHKSIDEVKDEVNHLKELVAEYMDETGFADLDDADRVALIGHVKGYSERNCILVVIQIPDATDVRTYRQWQELGRQVRKGETGARLLKPSGSKTWEETGKDGKPEQHSRQFFKPFSVFDITQTDPKDA